VYIQPTTLLVYYLHNKLLSLDSWMVDDLLSKKLLHVLGEITGNILWLQKSSWLRFFTGFATPDPSELYANQCSTIFILRGAGLQAGMNDFLEKGLERWK
jgi:hypothetical protein